MDFENIKRIMDKENMDRHQIPDSIKEVTGSKMPIEKVQNSMKSEIIAQLVLIVVFFAAPAIIELHQLPQSIYLILVFLTSLMTLGYIMKMTWFLKKSGNLNSNSKDSVMTFIYDLKLALEVYKTAIISGGLLLPLAFTTLFIGRVGVNKGPEYFSNILMFNVSNTTLILYILGYLLIAILFYFITVLWTNRLYGTHITKLENVLKEFDV